MLGYAVSQRSFGQTTITIFSAVHFSCIPARLGCMTAHFGYITAHLGGVADEGRHLKLLTLCFQPEHKRWASVILELLVDHYFVCLLFSRPIMLHDLRQKDDCTYCGVSLKMAQAWSTHALRISWEDIPSM